MEGLKTQEALVKAASRDLSAYLKQYNKIVSHKDVKKRMLSRATTVALSHGFLENDTKLLTHTEVTLAGLIRNMTECMMILQANRLVEQENKTATEGLTSDAKGE